MLLASPHNAHRCNPCGPRSRGSIRRPAIDDGEMLVAALSFDACLRGIPAGSMRSRASAVRAGRWPCEDRAGVARALDIAATLIESR